MNNCDCHCDVLRDGSGQRGRYLKALDPSYAPVDERRLEDLLVFARRYATLVRFYDIPEGTVALPEDTPQQTSKSVSQQTSKSTPAPKEAPPPPSWEEFFRRDLAVIAASIAVVDTSSAKRVYEQRRSDLDAHPNRATFRALFDPILKMAVQIDRWHAIAIEANPLHGDLELAINSALREQITKVRAYEEGFKYEDPTHPLDLDYSALDKTLWGLDHAVDADKSIYQGADRAARLRNAALYVDDVFQAFHGFMSDLVTVRSVGYVEFALESYPAHQPHMALFIAFLELFQLAQNEINGLTGRMLDFYYRDVLRLTPKPPIPDRVHVVFELAKDVVEYDVTSSTALNGGKDAAGKNLTYRTMTDLVVNQAKVKEIKNIYVAKRAATATTKGGVDAIFARPVADSRDGFGEKISDVSGKWATFGKGLAKTGALESLCDRIAAMNEPPETRKDEASIGFALASPQLVLQGGNRLIHWRIPRLRALPTLLQIRLTGEEGWLTIDTALDRPHFKLLAEVEKTGVFDPGLNYTSGRYFIDDDDLYIHLPVSEQSVVAFDPALHPGYPYSTGFPVAEVRIGAGIELSALQSLRLRAQSLSVRVGSMTPVKDHPPATNLYFDGLKTLVLQNASGVVDGTKPFDPFTLYPQGGLALYVGSAEVFNKPFLPETNLGPSALAVNIRKTLDVDDDPLSPPRDSERYSVHVLRDRQWVRLVHPDPSGRGADGNFERSDLARDILWKRKAVGETVEPEALPRAPVEPVDDLTLKSRKGFLKLTLLVPRDGEIFRTTPLNFEESQKLAPALQVKEISVSYYSELRALETGVEQFFHVYPFGVTEVFLGSLDTGSDIQRARTDDRESFAALDALKDGLLVDARQLLLPQFTYVGANTAYRQALEDAKKPPASIRTGSLTRAKSTCEAFIEKLVDEASASQHGAAANQYSGKDPEEGILLIGIENLRPLDTLSLLFQFAEGSAADEDNDPPEIHWSYLTNNEWRPLKGENLVADGTYGFQTTGIVKIDVPADITDNNTIVTAGLCWFSASVSEHADRIPMLVSVVTQAAEAALDDNDNDPSHFDTALPPGSISKLAVAVTEIAKVAQPFASFDGKHREIGKEFYTRVSERLRHKARAITAWDYEHLVLDRYPSIYKVKCITHTDPNCLCRASQDEKSCCGPQVAPGHVLVVPISNLKNRNAVNPLQPKTSRRTLLAIEDYLRTRTSPFVHVHARNPVYEQILVFFQVQFIEGTNKGYFLKKLNDEIVHYLTPWAFDEQAELSFAQKVYASAIINFIEERPYVDFIADFLMFVCRDECCPDTPVTPSDSIPLADALERLRGCCDTEKVFVSEGHEFICEVIAQPSTPRSILVSAPRHIIIPYETTPEPTPCEKRRMAPSSTPAPAPPAPVPAVKQAVRKTAMRGKPAGEAKAKSGKKKTP